MLLKKPGILLSSYNGFQSFTCPSSQINTSPCPTAPRQSWRPTSAPSSGRQAQQSRTYADVGNEKSWPNAENLHWPDMTSATAIPTPYQIFDQRKGAPYSKRRFYDLVKLYHPDRYWYDHDSSSKCSQAVKLERYRLIVAANNILSDPVKRNAYDRWGAGWAGKPGVGDSRQAWGNASGAEWSGFNDNSPTQNATWEDWERWYQRDAKGRPQEPQYFSNAAFISLIVVFAAFGGIGQAKRVGTHSMNFIEQRDQIHDTASRELARARRDPTEPENRDERIQCFLKMRDPVGYGVVDQHEEGYRRLLPEPEVCSSVDIKDRSMDVYHSDIDRR
ncbi:MAG: hypothetical protein M1835_002883 [Candelina submexicana]|nr:MAG: hypothetical protein M1835_002883 [Candelina submexicana]